MFKIVKDLATYICSYKVSAKYKATPIGLYISFPLLDVTISMRVGRQVIIIILLFTCMIAI